MRSLPVSQEGIQPLSVLGLGACTVPAWRRRTATFAHSLHRQGKDVQAIEAYDLAIGYNPNDPERATAGRGTVLAAPWSER